MRPLCVLSGAVLAVLLVSSASAPAQDARPCAASSAQVSGLGDDHGCFG